MNIETLERMVQLSLLYDFYGALLTEHKRQIFEDYILNGYSLSEIALQQNMTRQGVYDIVKRCGKELKEYEEKLCLIEKFENTKKIIRKIHKAAGQLKVSGDIKQIELIEQLSNMILEE